MDFNAASFITYGGKRTLRLPNRATAFDFPVKETFICVRSSLPPAPVIGPVLLLATVNNEKGFHLVLFTEVASRLRL